MSRRGPVTARRIISAFSDRKKSDTRDPRKSPGLDYTARRTRLVVVALAGEETLLWRNREPAGAACRLRAVGESGTSADWLLAAAQPRCQSDRCLLFPRDPSGLHRPGRHRPGSLVNTLTQFNPVCLQVSVEARCLSEVLLCVSNKTKTTSQLSLAADATPDGRPPARAGQTMRLPRRDPRRQPLTNCGPPSTTVTAD
ncbi:unnamed protein product [Arctogadus glacialis]